MEVLDWVSRNLPHHKIVFLFFFGLSWCSPLNVLKQITQFTNFICDLHPSWSCHNKSYPPPTPCAFNKTKLLPLVLFMENFQCIFCSKKKKKLLLKRNAIFLHVLCFFFCNFEWIFVEICRWMAFRKAFMQWSDQAVVIVCVHFIKWLEFVEKPLTQVLIDRKEKWCRVWSAKGLLHRKRG